jgi:hypothetical protein
MDWRIGRPAGSCGVIIGSLCPLPPSRTGWRPGGKRASERLETDYLAWALADFSGYLAADELYDGPFCILSIVDNRTFKRLFFQVLDHDPKQEDMITFFERFQVVLQARQLAVQGITTDGSSLYPAAIQAVWGDLPHQICEFHTAAVRRQRPEPGHLAGGGAGA